MTITRTLVYEGEEENLRVHLKLRRIKGKTPVPGCITITETYNSHGEWVKEMVDEGK